jgi:hypothetical protein
VRSISRAPRAAPRPPTAAAASAAGGQFVQRTLQARVQARGGVTVQNALAGSARGGASCGSDDGLGRVDAGCVFACADCRARLLEAAAQGALNQTVTCGPPETLAGALGCGYVTCHGKSGGRLLGLVGGDARCGIQRERRGTVALGKPLALYAQLLVAVVAAALGLCSGRNHRKSWPSSGVRGAGTMATGPGLVKAFPARVVRIRSLGQWASSHRCGSGGQESGG